MSGSELRPSGTFHFGRTGFMIGQDLDPVFFRLSIPLMHQPDVSFGDVVVMPEASPEILRNMHQLMDDGFLLFCVVELVESLGNELQHVKGLHPHRNLQDFTHSMTSGDDSSCRRTITSDTDDLVQIDVVKIQRLNDIRKTRLDIFCDLIANIFPFSFRHPISELTASYFGCFFLSLSILDSRILTINLLLNFLIGMRGEGILSSNRVQNRL